MDEELYAMEFRSLSGFPKLRASLRTAAALCKKTAEALPPVIAVLAPGVTLAPAMDSLCDELESYSLVRFTGERRLMTFKVTYAAGEDFPAMTHMMYRLRNVSGYRNRFGGVVMLDLSAWIDHADDERLDAVMAYICDHMKDAFFIISITSDEPEKARRIVSTARRWFYAIDAEISATELDSLTGTVTEKLCSMGFSLKNDQAVETISATMQHMMHSNSFAGARDAEIFASAIAFCAGKRKTITAEIVKECNWDDNGTIQGTIGFRG